MELMANGTRILVIIIYISIFSLVSPLGIGIGIGITNASCQRTRGHYLAIGILQGFAAGTILYIVFFEVSSAF